MSCQIRNVQDSGPGTSAWQARHRPHQAAHSAQRKLGKSPQQDGRTIKQSLISSFASCPQAQQPQCWLLALCQTHSAAAQELAVRQPLGPPTPHPGASRTSSYLRVSFIHRGVHREGNDWEERERELGSLLCSEGRAQCFLSGFIGGSVNQRAPPQNCPHPNEMLGG